MVNKPLRPAISGGDVARRARLPTIMIWLFTFFESETSKLNPLVAGFVFCFLCCFTRLQICPLNIFGNKAADGTYRSKYWFPGFGFDSGPNLRPCFTFYNGFEHHHRKKVFILPGPGLCVQLFHVEKSDQRFIAQHNSQEWRRGVDHGLQCASRWARTGST